MEDKTSKAYWGPRLWNIFHHLAAISDRRDMSMLWNNLMRLTATVMPCELCRLHLAAYMRTHAFVRFPKIHSLTGAMVRDKAVQELYNLHNSVNSRLEKQIFTEITIYVKLRSEAIIEINRSYDEIKVAWTPLVHSRINGAAYNEWKKHLNMMIALAAGGPD